jgi:O-antigen ligase
MTDTAPILRQASFWIFILTLFAFGAVAALGLGLPLFLSAALAFSAASIILAFRAPLALLCLLIVVRMSLDYSAQYMSVTVFDITLSLSQLLGIGIASLGLLIAALHRRLLPGFPLKTPFLIIAIWGTLTLVYSIAPKSTFQELLRFFDLYALAFLSYIAIKNTDDFRTMLRAVLISGILPISLGIYQYLFHIGLTDENVSIPRIFGTFSHPNVYSLYLFALVVFSALSFLAYARDRQEKLFALLFLFASSGVLFLTFARVAWVALAVFILMLALFRYRVLLLPLALAPAILLSFSPAFQARVAESLHPGPDSSIVWRQMLWHDVTEYARQKDLTLFGSGFDTFPRLSESLRGTALGPNEPHNDFVKFFVEGGFVGLAVFATYLLSLLVIMIRRYFAAAPESTLRLSYGILILFFLALMLSALTDNVFKNTPVQWLFFIVLGSLLALSKNEKTPRARSL